MGGGRGQEALAGISGGIRGTFRLHSRYNFDPHPPMYRFSIGLWLRLRSWLGLTGQTEEKLSLNRSRCPDRL